MEWFNPPRSEYLVRGSQRHCLFFARCGCSVSRVKTPQEFRLWQSASASFQSLSTTTSNSKWLEVKARKRFSSQFASSSLSTSSRSLICAGSSNWSAHSRGLSYVVTRVDEQWQSLRKTVTACSTQLLPSHEIIWTKSQWKGYVSWKKAVFLFLSFFPFPPLLFSFFLFRLFSLFPTFYRCFLSVFLFPFYFLLNLKVNTAE